MLVWTDKHREGQCGWVCTDRHVGETVYYAFYGIFDTRAEAECAREVGGCWARVLWVNRHGKLSRSDQDQE